ncbi:MAG: DNA-processing protein DprA, partial [Chloroflexi bacterium]|nr:DNA-processing protein DprA [Chloroflexota bacterium]
MGRENGVTPLEPREYYRLLAWLEEHGLRPSDLVEVDLSEEPGLPVAGERLRTLLARGTALALTLETWESRGLWVVSGEDEDYPERLRGLGRTAPPLLYGTGDRQALARLGQALAVVGSRHVGAGALEVAQEVARACAGEGIAIVSGGARGVDSAAMEAAIEAGGRAG